MPCPKCGKENTMRDYAYVTEKGEYRKGHKCESCGYFVPL